MIKQLLNSTLLIIILLLSLAAIYTKSWVLVYLEFFVIVGFVRLLKGDMLWGYLLIILGTVLTDMLTYQTVGLTALVAILSIVLFRVLSKIFAPLDNQSAALRTLVTFFIFLLFSSVHYFGQGILNFGQIMWVCVINITILLVIMTISSLTNKTENAFRL